MDKLPALTYDQATHTSAWPKHYLVDVAPFRYMYGRATTGLYGLSACRNLLGLFEFCRHVEYYNKNVDVVYKKNPEKAKCWDDFFADERRVGPAMNHQVIFELDNFEWDDNEAWFNLDCTYVNCILPDGRVWPKTGWGSEQRHVDYRIYHLYNQMRLIITHFRQYSEFVNIRGRFFSLFEFEVILNSFIYERSDLYEMYLHDEVDRILGKPYEPFREARLHELAMDLDNWHKPNMHRYNDDDYRHLAKSYLEDLQ